ncbi:unnamed protein product, partial [Polarella glacialis]
MHLSKASDLALRWCCCCCCCCRCCCCCCCCLSSSSSLLLLWLLLLLLLSSWLLSGKCLDIGEALPRRGRVGVALLCPPIFPCRIVRIPLAPADQPQALPTVLFILTLAEQPGSNRI